MESAGRDCNAGPGPSVQGEKGLFGLGPATLELQTFPIQEGTHNGAGFSSGQVEVLYIMLVTSERIQKTFRELALPDRSPSPGCCGACGLRLQVTGT